MVCSLVQPVSLVNRIVQLTSYPETIEEEGSEAGSLCEEDSVSSMDPGGPPSDGGLELPTRCGKEQPPPEGAAVAPAPKSEEKAAVEIQKRRRLEQAGIKVMPAAQRFARLALQAQGWPGWLCACLGVCDLSGTLAFPSFYPTSCFSYRITVPYSNQIETAKSLCPRACVCYVLGYF